MLDAATLLYDCANWATAVEWAIPADAVSGLYFLRLARDNATGDSDAAGTLGWRQDDVGRTSAATPQFAKTGASGDPRPPPLPHAYGALGHGALRDALAEPRASHVWFVVRAHPAAAPAQLLVQTADTTWQAYNRFGGAALYGGVGVGHGASAYGGGGLDPEQPARRAFKVSYNRPLVARDYRSINMPLGAEVPGILWLERNGYDAHYVAAADVDAGGAALLARHGAFMSLGHDEYASQNQFDALRQARRDNGTALIFWSANQYFWRVRWEPDAAGAPGRVMACYKETQSDQKLDPLSSEWTGTFRDARAFNPLGAQPENELSGLLFTVNAWRNDAMEVPTPMAALRFWRGAHLDSDAGVVPQGVLGHEWDEDVNNGASRPACMAHLSRTEVDGVLYIQDHGAVYDSGSATHRMVAFRDANSGALTWATGTVQWSWALEGLHDGGGEGGVPPERANPFSTRARRDRRGVSRAAQQLSANMLAEAGLRAHTPQPELLPPAPSADAAAPTSRVLHVSPQLIEIAASDAGGGHVAGVEVSWDGGRTWALAERAEFVPGAAAGTWALRRGPGAEWPDGATPHTVRSRAVDDSLNCQQVEAAETAQDNHGEL